MNEEMNEEKTKRRRREDEEKTKRREEPTCTSACYVMACVRCNMYTVHMCSVHVCGVWCAACGLQCAVLHTNTGGAYSPSPPGTTKRTADCYYRLYLSFFLLLPQVLRKERLPIKY